MINYYLIIEHYLNVMNFTERERNEVKISLLAKVKYFMDTGRNKKELENRIAELIEEIEIRNIEKYGWEGCEMS